MVENQIDDDGNCQFRALADQLFNGDQGLHAKCRPVAHQTAEERAGSLQGVRNRGMGLVRE